MELEVRHNKLIISFWLEIGLPSLPHVPQGLQVPGFILALFNIKNMRITVATADPSGPYYIGPVVSEKG